MSGPARQGLGRTIAVVPAALTVGNLFLGFFSIVNSGSGRFLMAATLIVIAAVLDKFDGLIARATGTASEFGRELDSLADLVSFGVAPSLLAWHWGLHPFGKVGWGVAFFFLTCGALRLARFNVQTGTSDNRFFVGLPIPMAASVPATLVLSRGLAKEHGGELALQAGLASWAFLVLVAIVGFLMVSNLRYHAFKQLRVGRQRRLPLLLGLVAGVYALAAWPAIVLPGAALAYVAHGPLMRLLPWLAGRPRRPEDEGAQAPESAPASPGEAAESEGGG